MNLVNFILRLAFVAFVSGYDHGSSYITRSEHPIPSSNYHQQDHHENSELNHEIYVHETNSEDDGAHAGAGSHGGYGFPLSQKDSNQLYGGGESSGHLHSANQSPDYSHGGSEHSHGVSEHSYGGSEHSYGGDEALGHSHAAHQDFGHSYGSEDSGNSHDDHQNFGHSYVSEQNVHGAHQTAEYSHGDEASGKNEESHSSDGNSGLEGSSHGEHKDYYHHPAYKYEYGVHDPKTKDRHSQWEHRDGDVVKGEYTLDEPDGTIRKVSYSSDKHTGFTAHVERIGHAIHPESHSGHDSGHEKASEYTSSDGHY